MRLYYLDTSALLKRYKIEKGSENIDELFASFPPAKKRMITSVFTIVEIASAGERLFRAGTISKTTYGKLMNSFAADADRYLHFLSLDDGIVLSAADMVRRYSLRPGDALQLASLERSRDAIMGYDIEIVFVASDSVLCSAAIKEGFKALNPAEVSDKEWKKILK